MKRYLLALLTSFAFLATGAFSSMALNLGDTMWLPYMGRIHNQRDINPDTGRSFEADDYTCSHHAMLHCMQVLYNAYYGLESNPVDLYTIPVTGAGIVTYKTNPTGTFPNYDDVYFRYNDSEIYELPTPITAQNIIDWLPYTPVVIRIVNWGCVPEATTWMDGDAIVTWDGNSSLTGDFHDCLVVDYGQDAYGALYFTIMNSYYFQGYPGYFKMYIGSGEWIGQTDINGRSCAKFVRIHNSISTNPKGFGGDSNLNYSFAPRIFPQFIPTGADYTYTYMYGTPQSPNPIESIYINCDIVIPNSKSFYVREGTTVKVNPESQGPNLGGYLDKNEIIVNGGTLGGGLSLGNDVTISSAAEYPSAGDWGRIKLSPSSSLMVGDRVTIRDAIIGLFVESSGDSISFPDRGTTTGRKCTIANCRDWGMLITSSPTEIKNIDFNGNGTTDSHGSLCVMGAGALPVINNVTFSGGTVYGAYVSNYSNMDIKYSLFDDSIQKHMIFLYSPSTSVSLFEGYNNFLYDGDGTYHAIWNPSSFNLNVTRNFWNNETNQGWLFENPSYITNAQDAPSNSTAGAFKIASLPNQSNLFSEAKRMEQSGSFIAARDIYRQILLSSDNPHEKSRAIKSLIRTFESDPTVTDLRECDLIVREQGAEASGWYKALLDYLQCELVVKEARKEQQGSGLSTEEKNERYRDKIAEAIRQFTLKSDEYAGTDMQVEMLARTAALYGDYLNDRSNARVCADKAASVNPGQPILLVAYQAAGMEYDPWKYTDIYFAKHDDNYPQESLMDEDSVITISPNPFNPTTTISFTLTVSSKVKIAVYSVNGQKISELVDGMMHAGAHSVAFDGSKLASGVYFYRFESAGTTRTGKMLLVK